MSPSENKVIIIIIIIIPESSLNRIFCLVPLMSGLEGFYCISKGGKLVENISSWLLKERSSDKMS